MNIYFTTCNPDNLDLLANWNSSKNEHFVLWAYGKKGKFTNATVNEDYVFLISKDIKSNHENEILFNCKIVDDKVIFSNKEAYLNNEFDKDFIIKKTTLMIYIFTS